MEFLAFGVFLSLIFAIISRRDISDIRKRLHSVETRYNNLFKARSTGLGVSLPLMRTSTHIGWYTTNKSTSNEYFEVGISKELVTSEVMKIRVKRNCLLSIDSGANITVNGAETDCVSQMMFKPNDKIYFYGDEMNSYANVEVFDVPYVKVD